MKELDRRAFLKLGTAIAVGIAVGKVMPDLSFNINRVVGEISDYETGAAGVRVRIEESCKGSSNKDDCYANYEFSEADKFKAIYVVPFTEEVMFRAMPSSLLCSNEEQGPLKEIMLGTNGIFLTRRELGVGFLSSMIFGLAHNWTIKGFDTKTIPAGQTVGGFVLWYLQRKLGLFSNTLAHSINNFRAIG